MQLVLENVEIGACCVTLAVMGRLWGTLLQFRLSCLQWGACALSAFVSVVPTPWFLALAFDAPRNCFLHLVVHVGGVHMDVQVCAVVTVMLHRQ